MAADSAVAGDQARPPPAEELSPDLLVIGGGPGGLTAALAAASAGLSVVLVEKAVTGGRNLTSGAVPARALGAAADLYETLRQAPGFGISTGPVQADFAALSDHVSSVIGAGALNAAPARVAALDVRVILAEARFTGGRVIVAGPAIIRPVHTIVAVGAVPVIPDIPGLAEAEPLGSIADIDLNRKPSHVVILGAGGHALAAAQALVRLGIDATVIDEGPVLPGEDAELAAIVAERLVAEGVRLRTGTAIASVATRRGGVRLVLKDAVEGEVAIDASHIVVMGARAPDIDRLGLIAAGIAHTAQGILVDRRGRTSNRRVFAIGDCVAGPALAGRAIYEAAAVVNRLLSPLARAPDRSRVPRVTFTDPAIASVGLDEDEARRRHGVVQILRFPFAGNDLANAERLSAGAIKVVVSPNGTIRGVTIAGRNAAELIAPWALALANRLPIAAMRDLPVPYPSRSEIARQAAALYVPGGLTHELRQRIIQFFRQFG